MLHLDEGWCKSPATHLTQIPKNYIVPNVNNHRNIVNMTWNCQTTLGGYLFVSAEMQKTLMPGRDVSYLAL